MSKHYSSFYISKLKISFGVVFSSYFLDKKLIKRNKKSRYFV